MEVAGTVLDSIKIKNEAVGEAVREIVSHGNDAEVKRNKDGDIIILEVRKKIIKRISGL